MTSKIVHDGNAVISYFNSGLELDSELGQFQFICFGRFFRNDIRISNTILQIGLQHKNLSINYLEVNEELKF